MENVEKAREVMAMIKKTVATDYPALGGDFIRTSDIEIKKLVNFRRMEQYLWLYDTALINKQDSIVTIFTIHLRAPAIKSIYAFLYSVEVGGALKHEYVCFGPTFISSDGEFREPVLPFSTFEKFIEGFANRDDTEKFLLNKLVEGEVSLQYNILLPNKYKDKRRAFSDSISSNRLELLFLMKCYFNYCILMKRGVFANSNRNYNTIMENINDNTLKKAIIDAVVAKGVGGLKLGISARLQFGQKISPLTISMAANPLNISFQTWRELYIDYRAAELVINAISHVVPLPLTWFLLNEMTRDIFDNPSMMQKYEDSDIGNKIVEQVTEADRLNYIDENRSGFPINYSFAEVSYYLREGILVTGKDVRLSDVALGKTVETVGITWGNNLAKMKELYRGTEDERFHIVEIEKFLFDLSYGLYCLASRLGVIHGDLHLNNVTMNRGDIEDNDRTGARMVCIIGKKTFVLPQLNLYAHIIDFSRGMIFDRITLEAEFGRGLSETVMVEQTEQFVRSVLQRAPELVEKHLAQVQSLFRTNLELAVKIFSGVDLYVFLVLLVEIFFKDSFFQMANRVTDAIEPGVIELVKRMRTFMQDLMNKNIRMAISGSLKSAENVEWPCLDFINEFFSHYCQDTYDGSYDIYDIYNYNNSLKYSLLHYDDWPQIMKFEHQLEICKVLGIEGKKEGMERVEQMKPAGWENKIIHFLQKYKEEYEAISEHKKWFSFQ